MESGEPETGRITDLKKGDVLPAPGARIYAHDNATANLLFSNQTSVIVMKNTSLRVEKFDQEPFQPNNNLLIEPSNSQLIVYVQDGQIVISTPQLLSGSRLVFESQHCAASILNNQSGGQKAFLITDDKSTHFGMIQGEARVNVRDKNGTLAILGAAIKTNQEAFVRPTLGSEDDKKNGLAVNEGITGNITGNLATTKAGRGDHGAVPLGQFMVVAASGSAEYSINGKPAPLKQGDSIVANGTTVKTSADGKLDLLFANQTVLGLGQNTEMNVQQFQQEPFAPGSSLEGIEPSNSQTLVVVRSGSVDIDTPQLLAGTHLTFETVHGAVGIMNGQNGGEKATITVNKELTDIVMTQGLANVHKRNPDGTLGDAQALTTGQEAVVRPTIGANPTLAAAAQTDSNPTVALGQFYVRRVAGSAQVALPGRLPHALLPGDAMPAEGATVTTAAGGKVTLLFSNQTSLFIEEKTELKVDQYQQEPFGVAASLQVEPSNSQSHITVNSGQIDIETAQLQTGSHLVFETPHSSIAILNVQSGGEKAALNVDAKQTDFQLTLGRASVMQRGNDGKFVTRGTDLKTGDEAIVKPVLTGHASALAVSGSAISNANAIRVDVTDAPVAPAGSLATDQPAQARVLEGGRNRPRPASPPRPAKRTWSSARSCPRVR